jgi:Brp/Blh family beta-carotene 15,15'-monooxygenase
MKLFDSILLVLTLLIGVASIYVSIPADWQQVVFFLLVVVIGISHGSIDHIIDYEINSGSKKFSLRSFLNYYLSIIAMATIAWFIFPVPCFILFLFISAYHFGQAQMSEHLNKLPRWFRKTLFLLWGNIYLFSLIDFHFDTTVSSFPFVFNAFQTEALPLIQMLSGAIWMISLLIFEITLLYQLIRHRNKSWRWLLQMLIPGALILLNLWTPGLLSFAIFFGLWHGLKMIIRQYDILKKHSSMYSFNVRQLIIQMLPFSLMSYGGVLLIAQFKEVLFAEQLFPIMTIIFISVLAMPHAIIMDRMYANIKSIRPKKHFLSRITA